MQANSQPVGPGLPRTGGGKATDEFMAVAAHDLRNPIAVVRASGQMALRQLDRGDLEAARRRLKSIIGQADRLSDLLESFLDAARLDTQRLPLRREHHDLAELVQDAVTAAQSMVGDGLDRALRLELPGGCIVWVDRPRLTRAVRALVENAMLYGDPAQPVRVSLQPNGTAAVVLVSGGGEGPLPEEDDQLFQPFYRGHAAAESGHSGSGLGLFNALGIARAHGGTVRRSTAEGGDAFELEVPLAS